MIEVSLLPNDSMFARLKMLPLADDAASCLASREGQKRVPVIPSGADGEGPPNRSLDSRVYNCVLSNFVRGPSHPLGMTRMFS